MIQIVIIGENGIILAYEDFYSWNWDAQNYVENWIINPQMKTIQIRHK